MDVTQQQKKSNVSRRPFAKPDPSQQRDVDLSYHPINNNKQQAPNVGDNFTD